MIVTQKRKKYADRTVRCYLTLNCSSMCGFCSADIPKVDPERRKEEISAWIWAEGINKRGRSTILAGGEPFLYRGFGKLLDMIRHDIKVEIYTNLLHNVDYFISKAGRAYMFLISLHPSALANLTEWQGRVEKLADAGHSLRFHVVRSDGYEKLTEHLVSSGIVGRYKTALCGDQRPGVRSRGAETNEKYPKVRCTSRIYAYGPDGRRYMCIHDLIRGVNGREHILDGDSTDWLTNLSCREFGYCTPCDNNLDGYVEVS